ncbi:MAG: DUF5667 domain-containing protein [Candidatus Doudnabacteria bacterium]
MEPDQDKLDEIIDRLKTNGDVSDYKKDRKTSGLLTLLSQLNSLPKAHIPNFDFMRVKNQILDRIAARQEDRQESGWFVATVPRLLRIGTVVLGSVLIVISLTLGTSVAALNSVPGQAIYPLKKVVENIQLKLAPADQQSSLQIQFANNRVDELQQVLQQQQDGQISDKTAQKIVSDTVKDLQKTATAAANASGQQPKAAIATKLADLSNKLKVASITSEGEVKIELEQTIANIQLAGAKADDNSNSSDNSVSAQGKLTAVTNTYVSIGSAKFLVSKDTAYVNTTAADLTIDQQVDIDGIIKDNKTYAQTITLTQDPTTVTQPDPKATDAKTSDSKPVDDAKTETPAADTTPASQ